MTQLDVLHSRCLLDFETKMRVEGYLIVRDPSGYIKFLCMWCGQKLTSGVSVLLLMFGLELFLFSLRQGISLKVELLASSLKILVSTSPVL